MGFDSFDDYSLRRLLSYHCDRIDFSISISSYRFSLIGRRNANEGIERQHDDDTRIQRATISGTEPNQNANLNSNEVSVTNGAAQVFRRIQSAENNPPAIMGVIDFGALLPVIVSGLDSPDSKIQFNASQSLTNFASTGNAHIVAEQDGAIPKMVKLLLSSDPNVREQCTRCLGIIAGDSVPLRDIVLNEHAMTPL